MLQITEDKNLGRNFIGYESYFFSSTEKTSECVMDFSEIECVLISDTHSKVADSTHFRTLKDRKTLQKDFHEFLEMVKINPKECTKPIYSLCIYLGDRDGYVKEDYQEVVNLTKQYCKQYHTWAILIPQYKQLVKGSKMSYIGEHVNIMFQRPTDDKGMAILGTELCDYIEKYK